MMFALSLSLLAATAWAGDGQVIGNGGNAVYCKTPVPSARLLDLYEGQIFYGVKPPVYLTLPREPIAWAKRQVERLTPLDPDYAGLVKDELGVVMRKFRLLPAGHSLVYIPDSFHVAVPAECAIRQLAIYSKDFGLVVDGDLWALMSDFERGALLVHEAVYKVERDLVKATDSIATRRIVAYLFSGEELTLQAWRRVIRPKRQN